MRVTAAVTEDVLSLLVSDRRVTAHIHLATVATITITITINKHKNRHLCPLYYIILHVSTLRGEV